jgi:hypothetical protein
LIKRLEEQKFRFRNDSGTRVLLGIETILVISMEDFVFKTFLFVRLFSKDYLMVDESHVTLSSKALCMVDQSRKENLVEYGFDFCDG